MRPGSSPNDGPVIFTPDTEPYLGREPVLHFDKMITAVMEQQHRIAAWTRGHRLTRIQVAASQLVPGGSSIALSIRELIRQGYLFSAMILLRPLVERVGTLTFLIQNPEALDRWERGWKHGTRPRFGEILTAMRGSPANPHGPTREELGLVASRYHSLVHGDPQAAQETLIALDDGSPGFTVGKDLDSPERADAVAFEATMYLVVLMARSAELFPEST
jgi:hypothetical protein